MKNSKGFTLIEVLIAMMIFASAIMIINNVWSANLFRISKAKMLNEVALLLQQKMTELEIKYKDKPLNEIPDSENGDFGADFPNYTWTLKTKEFKMPDLSAALASQEGGVDETTVILIKTMTEFINKSVKELKLTLSVDTPNSKRKKPLEYTVTNLLVNYDQEIAIPGMGGGGAGGGDQEKADGTGK